MINLIRPIILLCIAAVLFPVSAQKTMTGTWCVQDQGLSITFQGNDSVLVTSSEEDGANGKGAYSLSDSLLTATITSEDIVIRMCYQYKWQKDSSILARQIYFIADQDTAENPNTTVVMKRCGKSAGASLKTVAPKAAGPAAAPPPTTPSCKKAAIPKDSSSGK
jgi:hypothetical protein